MRIRDADVFRSLFLSTSRHFENFTVEFVAHFIKLCWKKRTTFYIYKYIFYIEKSTKKSFEEKKIN